MYEYFRIHPLSPQEAERLARFCSKANPLLAEFDADRVFEAIAQYMEAVRLNDPRSHNAERALRSEMASVASYLENSIINAAMSPGCGPWGHCRKMALMGGEALYGDEYQTMREELAYYLRGGNRTNARAITPWDKLDRMAISIPFAEYEPDVEGFIRGFPPEAAAIATAIAAHVAYAKIEYKEKTINVIQAKISALLSRGR